MEKTHDEESWVVVRSKRTGARKTAAWTKYTLITAVFLCRGYREFREKADRGQRKRWCAGSGEGRALNK